MFGSRGRLYKVFTHPFNLFWFAPKLYKLSRKDAPCILQTKQYHIQNSKDYSKTFFFLFWKLFTTAHVQYPQNGFGKLGFLKNKDDSITHSFYNLRCYPICTTEMIILNDNEGLINFCKRVSELLWWKEKQSGKNPYGVSKSLGFLLSGGQAPNHFSAANRAKAPWPCPRAQSPFPS